MAGGYAIKAEEVRVNTSGFSGNLDATQNDLQKVADALDDLDVIETDPVWSIDKALYQTTAQADGKYLQDSVADGKTYGRKDGAWSEVTTVETDPIWASDKSSYYTAVEIDGAAYLQSESDPVWISERGSYYTALEIDSAAYLQSESDPVWTSEKGGYYTAIEIDEAAYLQSESDPVWEVDKALYQTTEQADAKYLQSESDPVWASEKSDYYTAVEIDGFAYLQSESDPLSLHLDQTTPQTITATDVTITASDEVYFGDVTDSTKIKKDTVQGILDLVPAPDLSAYAKLDGTNQPFTGDVEIATDEHSKITVNALPSDFTYGIGGDSTTDIEVAGTFYRVHTFSTTGSTTFTTPSADIDFLLIAGGGGGANGLSNSRAGGGGGAGGYISGTGVSYPVGTSLNVTIGAGGGTHTAGSNSVFDTYTAVGGGYGGNPSNSSSEAGGNGGSGGGSGNCSSSAGSGGTATTGQGHNGGKGSASGAQGGSAGSGGGAGAVGNPGVANSNVRVTGGAGLANTITGSSVTYAVGGTGGQQAGGSSGETGTANRGNGGGGGAGNSGSGGSGGSGVLIVRYEIPNPNYSPEVVLEADSTQTARLWTDGDSSSAIKIDDATGTVVTIEQGSGDTTFAGDLAANNLSGTNTGDQNDHGTLDGLSDDDHTQYALADGTRGDFLKLDQTTPQTTVGRFTFPDLTIGTNTIYTTNGNVLIGTSTDNALDKFQLNGQVVLGGNVLVAPTGSSATRQTWYGIPFALEVQFNPTNNGDGSNYSYPMGFRNTDGVGGNFVFTSFSTAVATAHAGMVQVENDKGGFGFSATKDITLKTNGWTSTPSIIVRKVSDGNDKIGINTSAPDKALEVNLGTSSALRLTYNDKNGSASKYADFTVASTGATTITNTANIFTFGNGVADTDYIVNFTGTTNSGVFKWMEDEDYFQFSDDVMLPDNEAVKFGTGVDATILYDGTNLVINPKEVGSGILDVSGTVQSDGYNSADGTAGATADVATLAPDGTTTRTLHFKSGLYTGYTDS